MALLVPLASQVGLQLLLAPATSSLVANGACTAFGVAYPAYASFKAIESKEAQPDGNRQLQQWITYWCIFGTLSAAETVLPRSRVPGYYHAKLIFLLWLQSSHFQGGKRLYTEVIRPRLLEHESRIDQIVASIHGLLNRYEVRVVGNYVQQLLAGVPYLEWFVRSPADTGADDLAPSTPPKSSWGF